MHATILAAALSGCSKEAPAELPAVTVPAGLSSGVKEVVEAAWPKAVAACPGLVKYAGDLTFDGVGDNFSVAPAAAQRIEVIYRVAENPKQVPPEYRAAGQRCFFSLSPDGKKLSISKSSCANVCLDSSAGTGDTSIAL